MESPINPAIWKYLFHGTVATLAGFSLLSLFHERARSLSSVVPLFRELQAAATPKERVAALDAVLARLKEDGAAKKGLSRLAAQHYGAALLRHAALSKDGADAEVARAAVKVLVRVFGAEADGAGALSRLGGYRTLLTTLSEAHRQGRQELMEETAQALQALTQVNDADVVLETDVPKGAEGAYALACTPAIVKMLRVLDPQSPILLLNALTGIFANVCALRVGALAVGRGVEGRSGVSFFLLLLEHSNMAVVEHCALAIRYLARAGIGHEELAEEASLLRIADNFSVNSDPRINNSILTIILVMFDSKCGPQFFTNLTEKTDILSTMFEMWCHCAEKTLRDRSKVLLQLLSRIPQCKAAVQNYFERYRAEILERGKKDEEEARRREMQQMRQQQMMQQMMMGNMGMGPGMDMSELMGE